MANTEFSGFVRDDAGAAIASATVELFDRGTTTPVRETTTTNSSGFWTMSESTEGRYDVKVYKDSWVRWIDYDDEGQMESLEVKNLYVRGSDNAFDGKLAAPAWGADRTLTFRDATGIIHVGNYGYASVASNGTLQSNSFNVTSAAKNSTGSYTITWNTDFGNANYTCVATPEAGDGYSAQVNTVATGTIGVTTFDAANPPAPGDSAFHVFAIGDQ
jgi:hypothetical protein